MRYGKKSQPGIRFRNMTLPPIKISLLFLIGVPSDLIDVALLQFVFHSVWCTVRRKWDYQQLQRDESFSFMDGQARRERVVIMRFYTQSFLSQFSFTRPPCFMKVKAIVVVE